MGKSTLIETWKELLPYNKGQVKKTNLTGLQLHLQVIWKSRLEAKILKSNKQSITEKKQSMFLRAS